MDFRYLGNSGLKVSEISYGNWLTHGSQVEEEQATACVRAALEAGITTFDTADVYATPRPRRSSARRWRASGASRWRSSRRSTGRPGPGGPNDTGLSRKHIHESINGVAEAAARPTTSTSTRRTGTTTRRRWRRRWRPSPTSSAPARRSTSASREWTAEQLQEGHRAGPRAAHPVRLEPAAVQHALAGDRGRGRADVGGARHRPGRVLADRAGRADRQVPARPAAAGGLAGHRRAGRRRHDQAVPDRRRADPGAASSSRSRSEAGLSHGPARRSPGCCRTRTSPRRSSAPRGPSRSPRT